MCFNVIKEVALVTQHKLSQKDNARQTNFLRGLWNPMRTADRSDESGIFTKNKKDGRFFPLIMSGFGLQGAALFPQMGRQAPSNR